MEQLGGDTHEHGSHKGRTFAEDVKEAEKFCRFLLRDNPRKIRPGQRLNRPLEYRHPDSQKPELPGLVKLQRKEYHAKIADDRDLDQCSIAHLPG